MYANKDRLVIFDADGTLIDAFPIVERAFAHHGMDIGDLERFQRRRKLLKYLGGLKEFPRNVRRQLDKENRKQLKHTLTEIYREEAEMFPGVPALVQQLVETPNVRVGIVSRNVTIEPEKTLAIALRRNGIDSERLDFLRCIPLGDGKSEQFRALREGFGINPLLTYVCGDEYRDYAEAVVAGAQALIVSYGFEDHERLTEGLNVPSELVVRTPSEMVARLGHALDLGRCQMA